MPEIINSVVEVKTNGVLYSIRVLEETFGDNYNRFYSVWKYQQSEDYSSDDDDSKANNYLAVPEKVFSIGDRDDDIQRLNEEFSNQNFGKRDIFQARTMGSSKAEVEAKGSHRKAGKEPTMSLLNGAVTGRLEDGEAGHNKSTPQVGGNYLDKNNTTAEKVDGDRRYQEMRVGSSGLGPLGRDALVG